MPSPVTAALPSLADLKEQDRALIEGGWEPVAVVHETKEAKGPGWSTRDNTIDAITAERAALPNAISTGLRTGDVAGVDNDVVNEEHAAQIEALAFEVLGPTPYVRFGSKGAMYVYRNGTTIRKITVGKKGAGVEILGAGQQFVAQGIHPNGKHYRWQMPGLYDPFSAPVAELPEVTPEKLREFARRAADLLTRLGYADVKVTGDIETRTEGAPSLAKGKPVTPELLVSVLGALDPGQLYPVWSVIVAGIRATPGIELEDLREIADKWSSGEYWKGTAPSNYAGPAPIDEVFRTMPPKKGGVAFGTLKKMARDNGWTGNKSAEEAFAGHIGRTKAKGDAAQDKPGISNGIECSEAGLANAFAELFKDKYCYVVKERTWYKFDGKAWREDDTLAVRKAIKKFVWGFAERIDNPRVVQKTASATVVRNIEQLAQPELAIQADKWDTDPNTLCTLAGIVDLTTGNIRPAKPTDYCRRITAVAPAEPGTPFPNFKRVLDHITGGDKGLEAYLQKVAGYCLQGEQPEKAAFIFKGETGSGKTTFANALKNVMGNYARATNADTFTVDPRGFQKSTHELAMCAGYRLVIAAEPEKHLPLSDARIKSIVGEDFTFSRQLYQKGEDKRTTFKVILHCNDVRVTHGDPAVRDRLHFIPAGKTIPEGERDHDLPNKLEAEWPAILRWMIDGGLRWRREGLRKPAAVAACGVAYYQNEDPFEAWLREHTRPDDGAWCTVDDLFDDYCDYAADKGKVLDPKERPNFSKRITETVKGTEHKRRRVQGQGKPRGIQGLALTSQSTDAPASPPPYQSVPDAKPGEF